MLSLGPYAAGGRKIVRRKPQGFTAGTGQAAGTQSFQAGQGYAAPTPRAPLTAASGSGGVPSGAAAPPGPRANPWQPFVDAQVMGVNANLGIGLAGLDEAEKFLRLDYGLIAQPDGSFAVDVNNPAAKAAMLNRTYQQARRGDTTSMGSRGQLQSGAFERLQGERNRSEQMDFNSLTQQFSQGLGSIARQRLTLQANAGREEADIRLAGAQALSADEGYSGTAEAPQAAAASAPKAGYQFVMKSGPRAGMSYKLVPGKGPQAGKLVRQYEDGYREARP